MKRHKTGGKRL